MTDEEMQSHIELQSRTIDTQRSELQEKEQEIERLKAATAPAPTAGLTPEQIKEIQDKAQRADDLAKANETLQRQLDDSQLKAEFPQISDLSVVEGKTLDERREAAKKIAAMVKPPVTETAEEKAAREKQEAEAKAKAAGTPGEQFGNIPAGGVPNVDAMTDEEKKKHKAEMAEHMKSGNLEGVLGKIFETAPKATKALFQQ